MRKLRRTRGQVEQRVVLAVRWQQRDPEQRKVVVLGGAVMCSFTNDLLGFVVGSERTVDVLEDAVRADLRPGMEP